MNKLNKIVVGMTLASAIVSAPLYAAEQGELNATESTGKVDIRFEIVDQVQISNVKDITLGTFDGVNGLTGGQSFCVYRNGGKGYEMEVSSVDGTGFFAQSPTTGDSVEFSVRIDGDVDASDTTVIADGATSAAYNGSSALDCGVTDNASIQVDFAPTDLRAASTADDYKGTVVITVKPV